MSSAALYTPEVLALATGLADFPWDETLPLRTEARSRACGSTLALAIATDAEGCISAVGMKPHACAIGQAAAAIFAGAAIGRSGADIAVALGEIEDWLAGDKLPGWPGFAAISRARDYPGRHGAIRLAWQAASELLPTARLPR